LIFLICVLKNHDKSKSELYYYYKNCFPFEMNCFFQGSKMKKRLLFMYDKMFIKKNGGEEKGMENYGALTSGWRR